MAVDPAEPDDPLEPLEPPEPLPDDDPLPEDEPPLPDDDDDELSVLAGDVDGDPESEPDEEVLLSLEVSEPEPLSARSEDDLDDPRLSVL